MIKLLNRTELNTALTLVWKVFCEYEAVNYSESGKQKFWEAILKELQHIDLSKYKDSMAPLIQKDIKELKKVVE